MLFLTHTDRRAESAKYTDLKAMNKLRTKTLDVSRGYTYTYYTSLAQDKKQTLLLIHGFPDAADTFEEVIHDYLLPHGYGIVAVDCLGWNGSSKPTETAAYSQDFLAQDLIEILDKESIDKVVSVGHDWGSAVAPRFYNFHANRCSGVVCMSFAYIMPTPDHPFVLDENLESTQSLFGYGTYHYWKLFTGPDGAQVLDSHLESFWDVAHGYPETWLDTLCKPDGVRDFVLADKRQPTMPYATEERKQKWLASLKEFGLDAPLNYYRSMLDGVQDEADKKISKENYVIKVPFLYWGGQRDYVCRPELVQPSEDAGMLPDCTKVIVDSGHWAHLDKPKEFGEALTSWLGEKF